MYSRLVGSQCMQEQIIGVSNDGPLTILTSPHLKLEVDETVKSNEKSRTWEEERNLMSTGSKGSGLRSWVMSDVIRLCDNQYVWVLTLPEAEVHPCLILVCRNLWVSLRIYFVLIVIPVASVEELIKLSDSADWSANEIFSVSNLLCWTWDWIFFKGCLKKSLILLGGASFGGISDWIWILVKDVKTCLWMVSESLESASVRAEDSMWS